MYRITVRATNNRILIEREIDEPPNSSYFDELADEVQQDCYVDVCRVEGEGDCLNFEEGVEFELVRGDQYKDLEALEEDD